jgi:two-component SAPR family response regulator
MITKEEYNRFSTLYNNFISAKGNQSRKSQIIKDAIDVYREVPFTKLKDAFKNQ